MISTTSGRNEGEEGLQTPLFGMDLRLDLAQNLASTMDQISRLSSFKLLNFANISLDTRCVLGNGSFSRVYKYQ